jgi:hypothetical protein
MCVPMFIRTACQLRIMRIIIKVLGTNGRKLKEFIAIARYQKRLLLMRYRGHEDLILTL